MLTHRHFQIDWRRRTTLAQELRGVLEILVAAVAAALLGLLLVAIV